MIFGGIVFQAPRWKDRCQVCFDLSERCLAERFQCFFERTGTHGSQSGPELREVRSHRAVYIPLY